MLSKLPPCHSDGRDPRIPPGRTVDRCELVPIIGLAFLAGLRIQVGASPFFQQHHDKHQVLCVRYYGSISAIEKGVPTPASLDGTLFSCECRPFNLLGVPTHEIEKHQSFVARTRTTTTDAPPDEQFREPYLRRVGLVHPFDRHGRILRLADQILEVAKFHLAQRRVGCCIQSEKIFDNILWTDLLSPGLDVIRYRNPQQLKGDECVEIDWNLLVVL